MDIIKISVRIKKHDYHSSHKKVKEMAGVYKSKISYVLVNVENRTLNTQEELIAEWENYMENLFYDNRVGNNQIEAEMSPDILSAEVYQAIKTAKVDKADDPDVIHAENLWRRKI